MNGCIHQQVDAIEASEHQINNTLDLTLKAEISPDRKHRTLFDRSIRLKGIDLPLALCRHPRRVPPVDSRNVVFVSMRAAERRPERSARACEQTNALGHPFDPRPEP
jgi:hypothetical protein